MLVGSGLTQTHFNVHHSIITKRSGFFRAARSKRWTTDKSKPADLQDYDPRTFDRYLHCLYHNAVPKGPTLPESKPTPPPGTKRNSDIYKAYLSQEIVYQKAVDARYMELVRLYIVADSLADPTTANIVIDEIRRFSRFSVKNPSTEVINYVFRSTTDNDGLRILFADFYVYDDYQLPEGDLPKEFLHLIVKRFLAAKNGDDITVDDSQFTFFKDVEGSHGWVHHEYYQEVEEHEE